MEHWKPVVGFEGFYEVSDYGSVRSLDRFVTGVWGRSKKIQTQKRKGRILKPHVNDKRGGYRYVNLQKHGKQNMRRVARLVCAAHIGPCPEGMQVRHLDGVASNDRLKNLCYGTPKQNSDDRIIHGTLLQGEKSPNSILSEADVRRIKYGGEKRSVLADAFDVHPNHITNIRCGLRWSHV